MRARWRFHRFIWDLSGGRLGGRVLGMSVLELVTRGHKSGQQRRVLLTYVSTDNGPALAGTNTGAGSYPAWIKNLRANPRARILVDGTWREVEAVWVEGEEHEALWERFLHADDGYAKYEDMLERPIPIVVLQEPP